MAGWGLVTFRDDYGFFWLLWLIGVVVVTDILGYFAGRLIGGPKFWPRVSPKKTWSGTVAGWVGAALVGLAFRAFGRHVVGRDRAALDPRSPWPRSGATSPRARSSGRMGVKDSSALIPGHGGLFDRFDALLGASLFMLSSGRAAARASPAAREP